MNLKIIKNIVVATLPIFGYIIADYIFKDVVLSIVSALSIALLEFIISFVKFKKVDPFIFFDFLIILILSLLSLILKDPIFFKLKPAILEGALLVVFIPLVISKRFFEGYITRYFKNIQIDNNNFKKIQPLFFVMIPILIAHISLIVISAFFLSKEVWAFVSGVLLYIIFGVVIAIVFVYNLLKKRAFYNKYKNDEWFDIVNENGQIIGKAPRSICHNGSKLLPPVVHIHIFDSKHRLLLQKRSKSKDIQPGLWDTSVGGHISSGEKLEDALKREASEELGLNIDLNRFIPLSRYIYESTIEKELVFSFIYITDDKISFQTSEIDEIKFYQKGEVIELIKNGETTQNFNLEFKLLTEQKFINFDLFLYSNAFKRSIF